MGVRKRDNKWWVDFSFDGKRYRKPSPANTRTGAQAYETNLRHRLARGEPMETKETKKETKPPTFKEFAEQWMRDYVQVNNKFSEIETKKRILKVHLVPFFKGTPINVITNLDIEKFKALKAREGLSNKSINNYLAVLRKLLVTAEDWNLLEKVPKIKLLKVMPCKTDYLSFKECDELTSSADGIWRDMILFVIKTGLRFGEMVALKWEDIDFKNGQVIVRHSIVIDIPQDSTKSNKIRYVPIIEEVKLMLIERKKKTAKEYVFCQNDGHFLKRERCRRQLLKICERAGIRRIGWHTLRHTFASHLAEKGISPIAIKELLGHSDIKTTMRYAHLGPLAIKEAVKVLERPNWSQ